MPHVEVSDLRVLFRNAAGQDVAAVERIGFALERGETLGIVGESGSGKSTVARALLGFARPGARFDAGRVRVGGQDVLALPHAELQALRGAKAVMVPQNPLSSLTPHRTNGAQLTELIARHGDLRGTVARNRALDLMAATGLPEPKQLFDRYPHEISGGQRQRLVIASALVAEPELIVLDEPTTALDKTVEARVLDLVSRVQAELNATLIYVSHDLNVISKLCQRVLVMKDGEEVESGSTETVFNAPQNAYTRDLVAAIPRLDARSVRPLAGAHAPALQVDGLRFAYAPAKRLLARRRAGPTVVDDVSFAIAPGETLGVLGESGSGKSTMASVMAGALPGFSGRVLLGETEVKGAARARSLDLRRRIQMVFQDPLSSLNPTHTVEQTLTRPAMRYFGLNRTQARDKAAAMLADMDLGPDFLERWPRQLSGGQQQRIAIARALIAEPEVLICDEVTSALDVTIQAQVLRLLARLQAQFGLAIVFISHDLAVVAQVSDQILVLERGQVRDHGARDTVLDRPSHPYTQRLLAAYRGNEHARAAAGGPATLEAAV